MAQSNNPFNEPKKRAGPLECEEIIGKYKTKGTERIGYEDCLKNVIVLLPTSNSSLIPHPLLYYLLIFIVIVPLNQ
ncbi:hypothetical protein Hanom_Chr14g01304051 [Helianthus anomalus]